MSLINCAEARERFSAFLFVRMSGSHRERKSETKRGDRPSVSTQLTAALDTRIKSAHSSAFFSERESYCWTDFAWKDAARYMQDAEICALIAPRHLVIEMGKRDNKFDYRKTEYEFARLLPYYQAYHAENQLELEIVDTDHLIVFNS